MLSGEGESFDPEKIRRRFLLDSMNRYCPYCEQPKYAPDFRRRKCRDCVRASERAQRATPEGREKHRARVRRNSTPELRKKFADKYRQERPVDGLVRTIKMKCKKTGLPFDLDQHRDHYNALILLEGCELTGMPFELNAGWCWASPSFDRIKPELGYVRSNVRMILWGLNAAFGTWGPNVLVAMVEAMEARK